MSRPVSDIAFTPAVKAEQSRRGSRQQYERVEKGTGWSVEITPALAAFIAERRSFYLATTNSEGQPYIQHRGGAAGFLKVLDAQTIGFADYGGNRQYISIGNLQENDRAFLFLMDYARRARIKIWGRCTVVEDDAALIARLSEGGNAAAERAFVFKIAAWDRNCPQHIPQLVPLDKVEGTIASLQARIAELEAETARLRAGITP